MEYLPHAEEGTEYNPSIQSLLDKTDNDWGDPIKNRERAIPYGIDPLDQATYGIDPDGELIVVQGQEKNRKSTFAANVVANYMTHPKVGNHRPVTGIDTLESGMRPEKYRDVLLAIIAARYLMELGHTSKGRCSVCGVPECQELNISAKFLQYGSRTKAQLDAIDYAKTVMYQWPLLIHGPGVKQGNTRNLREAITGFRGQLARWLRMKEYYGMQILVVDHVQQYAFADVETDYEKQVRAIGEIGNFISQHSVACILLSQVSLGSVREAKSNGGRIIAAGGTKAAQEANTVFTISYNEDGKLVKIKIEEAREAPSFPIWINIEPKSGTFFGKAITEPPNS